MKKISTDMKLVGGLFLVLFLGIAILVKMMSVALSCPEGQEMRCSKADCHVELAYIRLGDFTVPHETEVCQKRECHCQPKAK